MIERECGQNTRENAGMSSESEVRNEAVECPRFPGEGSSTQGKSGPKARWKHVVDGQQVEIPVPNANRTVGTQEGSKSREWKYRFKHKGTCVGKPARVN